MRLWTPLLAALLLGARPEAGDVRKAKAYLTEVKKHLLESYIDRGRMKEEAVVRAAVRGMGAAMDHRDFAALDAATRTAVKDALEGRETLDGALGAVDRAAPALDLVKLSDHAARAMVRETGDPFSRILTQEDMNKLLQMLQGGSREESLGCAVQVADGRATVAYVQYGYPAYEEGVEIGDEVLEIRGRRAAEIEPDQVNELLKLDGPLELKIRRAGRDYAFKFVPGKTRVRDVRAKYLGQGVGYLRLTMFDQGLVGEARAALKKMASEGMNGLILDLRHNPGGALPAATGVADLFLPQGLLITRTESHYTPSLGGIKLPGFGLEKEMKTSARSEFESMPMACLVNGASASASELLAGALKDHKRAVLIGEKTYGKGVGQSPILLMSMFMQRYLYLTVMRYTTPEGNEVDHKGVAPDVVCREDLLSPEQFDAAWKVRTSGKLQEYVDAKWGDRLRKLAEYDGFETSGWEGFEALYRSLDTALDRDGVRAELRRAARRKAAGEGRVWVCDLESDRVLQRGLVEVLDLLAR